MQSGVPALASRGATTASLNYTNIYILYIVKSRLKGIFKEKVYLKNGYLIAAVGHHTSIIYKRTPSGAVLCICI